MNYSSEFIKNLYQDRDKIIIGLTGRTGSGCTSAARILRQENFQSISMTDINQLTGNQKRKALVIHKHARATWKKFYIITVSSVIIFITLKSLKQNTPYKLTSKTESLLNKLNEIVIKTKASDITYELAKEIS